MFSLSFFSIRIIVAIIGLVVLTNQKVRGSEISSVWSSSNPSSVSNWTQTASQVFFKSRIGISLTNFAGLLWAVGGLGAMWSMPVSDVNSTIDGHMWSPVWSSLPPFRPRGFHGAAAFVYGRLWIIGGWDGTNVFGDVWSTPDGVLWEQFIPNPGFPARHSFGLAVAQGQLWLTAGESYITYNDLYSTTNGQNWVSAPYGNKFYTARSHTAVCAFQDQLWVMGGYPGFADAWVTVNLASGISNWYQRSVSAPFGVRWGHQAVVYNGRVYLVGGVNGVSMFDDIWSSTDASNWVMETASAGFGGRGWFGLEVFKDRMWIVGGASSQNSGGGLFRNDVWCSPMLGSTVSPSPPVLPFASPSPSPIPQTRIDCVGHFQNITTCSTTCGTGLLTAVYIIDTPAMNGGWSCPYAAHYTSSLVCSVPCPDQAEWVNLTSLFPTQYNGQNGIFLLSRRLRDNAYQPLIKTDPNRDASWPLQLAYGTPDHYYPIVALVNERTIGTHPCQDPAMGYEPAQAVLNLSALFIRRIRGRVRNSANCGGAHPVRMQIGPGPTRWTGPGIEEYPLWDTTVDDRGAEVAFDVTVPEQYALAIYLRADSWDGTAACDHGEWVDVQYSSSVSNGGNNLGGLPVDCVGSFVGYGGCTVTCGYGKEVMRFVVTTPAANGGQACTYVDNYSYTRPCNTVPCSFFGTDCNGTFQDGGGCSASCGGGTKLSVYVVTTPAVGTGRSCPYPARFTQSLSCNTQPCADLCTLDYYLDYNGNDIPNTALITPTVSECCSYSRSIPRCQGFSYYMDSHLCNPKYNDRGRYNQTALMYHSIISGYWNSAVQGSMCMGTFKDTGACSASCGGGFMFSYYVIVVPATNGGQPCPYPNGFSRTLACNTHPCFAPISMCNAQPNCVNCLMATDSVGNGCGWCVATNECTTPYALNGDPNAMYLRCGQMMLHGTDPVFCRSTSPFNTSKNVDCVGAFRPTQACSASCGGGVITSMYFITTPAEGYGLPCPFPEYVYRTAMCNTHPCGIFAPINCVGDWSNPWPCSRSCGGGAQTLTFLISTPAANGGLPCAYPHYYSMTRPCNTYPCGGADEPVPKAPSSSSSSIGLIAPLTAIGAAAVVVAFGIVLYIRKSRRAAYVRQQQQQQAASQPAGEFTNLGASGGGGANTNIQPTPSDPHSHPSSTTSQQPALSPPPPPSGPPPPHVFASFAHQVHQHRYGHGYEMMGADGGV